MDQPDPGTGFLFIDGFDAALVRARQLAGDGRVSLGGGADLIRQGLAVGVVDELAISTAPVAATTAMPALHHVGSPCRLAREKVAEGCL